MASWPAAAPTRSGRQHHHLIGGDRQVDDELWAMSPNIAYTPSATYRTWPWSGVNRAMVASKRMALEPGSNAPVTTARAQKICPSLASSSS